MKPRTAGDWQLIDDAIDTALSVLRASTRSQLDRKAAMTNPLKAFNTVQLKG